VATANKKWGYDEAAVPEVECTKCGKKIGNAVYLLDAGFARFGNMFFLHETCVEKGDYVHKIASPRPDA
jgi:hypothetical protein